MVEISQHPTQSLPNVIPTDSILAAPLLTGAGRRQITASVTNASIFVTHVKLTGTIFDVVDRTQPLTEKLQDVIPLEPILAARQKTGVETLLLTVNVTVVLTTAFKTPSVFAPVHCNRSMKKQSTVYPTCHFDVAVHK